jgi:hypothetical protein
MKTGAEIVWTLGGIRRVLEAAGVEFIDAEGAGLGLGCEVPSRPNRRFSRIRHDACRSLPSTVYSF